MERLLEQIVETLPTATQYRHTDTNAIQLPLQISWFLLSPLLLAVFITVYSLSRVDVRNPPSGVCASGV